MTDSKCELRDEELLRVSGGNDNNKPIKINYDKCTKCNRCINECPCHAIESINEKLVINSNCVHCGVCYDYCNKGAIEINWEIF